MPKTTLSAGWRCGPECTVVHRHKVVRAHHHRALRVVRDYDGTPITIRRRPYGTADSYFVERASPTRYLNGQPVTRWAMM